MKKILLIMLSLLLISCQTVNYKETDKLAETPKKWWLALSNDERWYYYTVALKEIDKLIQLAENQGDDKEGLVESLTKNKDFLKKYKPFYPRWGFQISVTGLLDRTLTPDVLVSADALFFFLKGRMFISPGVNFKFYETPGGGVSLGLGFLFK